MARFAAIVIVVVAGAFLLWPDNAKESRPSQSTTLSPSPRPTGPLARGIEHSRAVITVRRGDREYELRGGLDLSQGYRFRGRITAGGGEYFEDGTPIWLAGGQGTWARMAGQYDTFTKPALPRNPPVWFDDHSPTLPLTGDPFSDGAEVYAHLSLLALKHAAHGRAFDFAAQSRRPPRSNELRKVAVAAGETDLSVTVGDTGQVERLRVQLEPATVDVRLFASDRPVPALRLRRFAME